jgi:hypothetical protein
VPASDAASGSLVSAERTSKEQVILRSVRRALRSVVVDTAAAPGLKHPLKERTREDIYYCFRLIEAREQELSPTATPADESGDPEQGSESAEERQDSPSGKG